MRYVQLRLGSRLPDRLRTLPALRPRSLMTAVALLVTVAAAGFVWASQAQAAGEIIIQFPGLEDQTYGQQAPDASLDVGANFVIQTVNRQVAVFDKLNGHKLAASTLDTFFEDGKFDHSYAASIVGPLEGRYACNESIQGQPQVFYDHLSQRWIITAVAYQDDQIDTGPYFQCMAITRNPTVRGFAPMLDSSDWAQYAFAIHPQYLHQFPQFGLWPDGIYMAANVVDVDNHGEHFTPKGVVAWVFNRDDLVAGVKTPPRTQDFYLSESLGYKSLLPSSLKGNPPPPGSPNIFASIAPPNQFQTWKFHVDWIHTGNSSFTGPEITTVEEFTWPTGILAQQFGVYDTIDIRGQRLMPPLQYRQDGGEATLWANHTVGSPTGTGIRWYEMNSLGATPAVKQHGTLLDVGVFRWLGSLAVDRQGNMAVGYSASSPVNYPDIRFSGRTAADPAGELQTETPLGQGTAVSLNDYNAPWSYYSRMTVDPDQNCQFWYTNQYYDAHSYHWQTRIVSFRLATCNGSTSRASVGGNGAIEALGFGSGIYNTDASPINTAGDGRFVLFESEAENLVDDDGNGHVDVFLYDRDANGDGRVDQAGDVTTTLISRNINNMPANADSGVQGIAISGDAQHIAFASEASDLVVGDTNGTVDVFVFDRSPPVVEEGEGEEGYDYNKGFSAVGRMVRISVDSAGVQGNAVSDQPSVSENGRFVTFRSFANNLVIGDNNGVADIFIHDRDADANGIYDEPSKTRTIRVSVDTYGNEAVGGHSYTPSISATGQYVAYASDATNLDSLMADGNRVTDIFVCDRDTDGNGIFDEENGTATWRVSVPALSGEANGRSYNPDISMSGGLVTYASNATNLEPHYVIVADDKQDEKSGYEHAYYDKSGTAHIFLSNVPPVPSYPELGFFNTLQISVNANGVAGNGPSYRPSISDDRIDGIVPSIAFESEATNFTTDTNGLRDIYVAKLATAPTLPPELAAKGNNPVAPQGGFLTRGTVQLVSIGYDGSASNGASFWPAISGSGKHVVFASEANNLIEGDSNNLRDVFVNNLLGVETNPPYPLANPAIGAGDCDQDGVVDIPDVAAVVAAAMGQGPLHNACDANSDGTVDAADLNCTLQIINEGDKAACLLPQAGS
ncbi:MAG: dockerin type I domain-containing protein [Chloroflexota bacterium]